MPVISVIIPVYNCEKYLSKCLDSVINQTYKDIEIICINDGSVDSSLDILNQYAKNDSRIIVMSQENKKQGAARNVGLYIAKGSYVIFLDSDDWLDLNYCEAMLAAATNNNADAAISVSTRDYKHKIKKHVDIKKLEIINDINELLPKIDYDLRVTGKMYKTSILNDLRFLEYAFYEDAPYAIRALHKAKISVLVPDTTYHYFSNPTSTIKTRQDERKRNDIIETQLDLINYAVEYNINIDNNFVVKDEHFPFKVKHYTDKREYYFCGIKYYTKFVKYQEEKIFVAVLMACFGDIILCNSLFQNIKKMYPKSKIVFVVDKPWFEIAKFQKDVDEVYIFDKRGENKGLFGLLKFIQKFPYKKIDYVFKIYDNFRADLIALFMHPRMIIGKPYDDKVKVQERHAKLLESITHKKIYNYPILFNSDNNIPENLKKYFIDGKKYIAICAASKLDIKDMPIETVKELMLKIKQENYEVLFIGKGKKFEDYAEKLNKLGCKFINLINQTTICELAQVLRNCEALISVDTGTMHFAYANNVPTVCVFYNSDNIKYWAPDKTLYPQTYIPDSVNVQDIFNSLQEALNGNTRR